LFFALSLASAATRARFGQVYDFGVNDYGSRLGRLWQAHAGVVLLTGKSANLHRDFFPRLQPDFDIYRLLGTQARSV
jgi:hypothetical protein